MQHKNNEIIGHTSARETKKNNKKYWDEYNSSKYNRFTVADML